MGVGAHQAEAKRKRLLGSLYSSHFPLAAQQPQPSPHMDTKTLTGQPPKIHLGTINLSKRGNKRSVNNEGINTFLTQAVFKQSLKFDKSCIKASLSHLAPFIPHQQLGGDFFCALLRFYRVS